MKKGVRSIFERVGSGKNKDGQSRRSKIMTYKTETILLQLFRHSDAHNSNTIKMIFFSHEASLSLDLLDLRIYLISMGWGKKGGGGGKGGGLGWRVNQEA